MRTAMVAWAAVLCWPVGIQSNDRTVALVVTADASDYLLSAGGMLAGMIQTGTDVYVVRVTNDEKDAWDRTPEQAALSTRAESEQAGRILGVKEVISMGYRAAELADVPFTSLRDRLIIYIRHYRPTVMFIPNPYTEYDRVLDRHYTGRASEDAWRAASLENFVSPFGAAGLKPHLTPELYYYAQPFDPRRREPESTAVFVPEPRIVDISGGIERKVKAVQALKTINYSMAMRLKNRLSSTGRTLPLLDAVNETSIDSLVRENVIGLAKISAQGTSYSLAEEFRFAGLTYRIPTKYLK